MGGQACILYGAAEFSRDLDLSRRYVHQCNDLTPQRPLLVFAPRGDIASLEEQLHNEQKIEKEIDTSQVSFLLSFFRWSIDKSPNESGLVQSAELDFCINITTQKY